MNNVWLSKSKYCKIVQCPKILWLNKYKPEAAEEIDNTIIFKNGNKVGELAKGLFGKSEDIPFDKKLNNMVEQTKELIPYSPNIITEASFIYDKNFCSVDILKNDPDGVEIYEVKSSTSVHDIYLDDAAYQYYVLSNLGLNVKKVAIVYINNEYYLEDELDIEQFFNITDITEIAIQKQEEIRENIKLINKYFEQYSKENEPEMEIGMHCSTPYECQYWQYCTRNLPKPNIFDISGMKTSTKFKNYNKGKISFEDLQNEELNWKYLEQIDHELHDKEEKIDKKAITQVIDSLKYPLYFLDYETYMVPIPEVQSTKAYQQLPFQYSLHIIKEKGATPEHKEYLAESDDPDFIRHFAENLTHDITEDGSVIVYNKSFEATRNNEIARIYPEYEEDMERINNNMIDFMEIFKNRNYYQKQMQGSYSIKHVLPALYPDDPELNYDNLEGIHKGDQASNTFIRIKNMTKEEQEEKREQLLKYCELDTKALVKIYEKFLEVIKE